MPLLDSKAPGFRDIKGWINSDPLSLEEGTYLLDFWSTSCLDCVRKTDAMQKLHEAYPGLTVVGVQAPEFGFEEQMENVNTAVEKHGINYPVAVDAEKATLAAYGDSYAPEHTLVHDGNVKWQGTAETRIEELEQELSEVLGVEQRGVDVSPDSGRKTSPDTYLGFRGCKGVNGGGNFRGEKEFELPDRRKLNQVYLDGRWRQEEKYLEAVDGRMLFHFQASQVNLVADPAGGIRDIEVRLDGEPVPHGKAGEDLRVEKGRSYLRVKQPGMYSAIEGQHGKSELTFIPEDKTRLHALRFR